MMEQVDVISENNEIIGQSTKDEVHRLGLPHRVSAILVQRPDKKFLIPTAASHKSEAGRLYHSAAGHVSSGESYRYAAVRELLEETGLESTANEIQYLGTYWSNFDYPTKIERERFEIFLVGYKEGSTISMNEEQVNPNWYSLVELKEILLNNKELLSLPLRLTLETILIKVPAITRN